MDNEKKVAIDPYWFGLAVTMVGACLVAAVSFGRLMNSIQNNTLAIQANAKSIVSLQKELNSVQISMTVTTSDIKHINETMCTISEDVKALLKKNN